MLRKTCCVLALCAAAACGDASVVDPNRGPGISDPTVQPSVQSMRGIVRSTEGGTWSWALELSGGELIPLGGATAQVAALQNEEVMITGIFIDGVMLVQSCQLVSDDTGVTRKTGRGR